MLKSKANTLSDIAFCLVIVIYPTIMSAVNNLNSSDAKEETKPPMTPPEKYR